ncbi:MAG: hypothetical protein HQL54_01775 [Magnetococcales bacterium]|nr:hypothetical protein [Magnetococcales bacterium]
MIQNKETAVVVLRPSESCQLIGQAVAALPTVQQRLSHGHMVIVGGSTTRCVAHALIDEDPGLDTFAVGWVNHGLLGETDPQLRGEGPIIFDNGAISRGWPGPVLEKFVANDIYIKGGNALDSRGNVGVLMGSPVGGTIGAAFTLLMARGGQLIIPISLQKQIPSVFHAVSLLGQGRVDRVMGMPVGMMPIPAGTATVVTEIEAFHTLFNVKATQVAAGGVGDSQGAVVIHLEGNRQNMNQAWDAVQTIRNGLDAP